LKDNGYLYSTFSQPKVEIDTEKNNDNVIIDFNPGKRFRINRVDFIDSSAKNQPPLAIDMKKLQLEFKIGDWASEKAINATKDNFLSLGTFEIVAIDTSSRFAPQKDSLINLIIFLLYRKEQEFNFGFSLNQTRIDNLVNFGVETNYRHRNIFNAAQEFSPYANVYLKDLGTVFSNQNYEFEMQLGFKFAQPLLWVIDNSRVSFLTSFNYSYKMFNNYFKISSFNLPVSFPIKFPKITYFNRASIDFNFLREDPVNFEEAKVKAYESAKTSNDSNNVIQSFILYQDLWNYLNQGKFYFFTSNTMGISISGDTRNNPFSPSQGYYTMVSLDGWNPLFFLSSISGLSRYLRFQLTNYQFFKLTPTTVLALKGKIGAINLLQKDNSYVPVDRLFFCGGPNSVRAWPSRQLRYTKFSPDSLQNSRTYSFLENFVGNGVLVEGSLELRFSFPKPPGLNKVLQEAIQNIKTTLFLDFGNAFHWYVNNADYEVSFLDYITKLAVGTGIGIRYETPIGPLRLDFAFPLYDPLKIRKPFSTMQFNFGIGHAF
jgi:outer membrane protein assembly factor BamA